ncbi:MAG TPA: hypothetical protein VKM54_29545 [Myxococcota bacterium]|nr:hypothetical protein [Myxococcota bacterium]
MMTRTSSQFSLGQPLSCPCGAELRLHLCDGVLYAACIEYPTGCHFAKRVLSEWLLDLIAFEIKNARRRGRSIATHLRKIAAKIEEQLKRDEKQGAQ